MVTFSNGNERQMDRIFWTCILILIGVIILCLTSCQKPPETYCWSCTYHQGVWTFCDYTQGQIDSLAATFTGCEKDSLICNKLNLIIH